jgi:hypothetical protein
MQYVEAPNNWERLPGQPSVFLAGGITGCPDWQNRIARSLALTNYAVLNPRRRPFPMGDPSATEQQITWEFRHLRKADVIAFWFCKETIQPIALFELGAWSQQKDPAVIVGVEPGYPRQVDIHLQMGLLGRSVVSSLEELASQLINIEHSISVRLANKA